MKKYRVVLENPNKDKNSPDTYSQGLHDSRFEANEKAQSLREKGYKVKVKEAK